jgi:phosphotransferase system enzyme I (PtsI)
MEEITLKGIAASNGIVTGPAFLYKPPDLTIPDRTAEAMEVEMERFKQACDQARLELITIKEAMLQRTGSQEEAAIFDAHVLMLQDPMLEEAVGQHLGAGKTIEQAVSQATQDLAAMLATMKDEYFAARSADMSDVGNRVLRILLGVPDTSISAMKMRSIVIAKDLTPSDTARMDPEMTLGFCTETGGLTSHTAILARTLGLPAVVGMGEHLLRTVREGDPLILDGNQGVVVVNPSLETGREFQINIETRQLRMGVMRAQAQQLTHTADHRRVEVGANVGEAASATQAVEMGAEGIGLLRTEFLYLSESQPPGEEKQLRAYREIFEIMGSRPVIVRTLDIGGDKPPAYIDFPKELNPFLGWRAIRICLDQPQYLKTQLRAILRAAIGHHALIMFPMISSLEELRQANRLLAEARSELDAEGLAYPGGIPVGIMVETPAAAMLAEDLAKECDFFSIGTNDLTQYTLAVDRTNERIAGLFQPLHPAVLRLIHRTIEAAHQNGIWVGMCGELAGMPAAIPILLGLGLDEFSMAPGSIPEAKWLIGRLTSERAGKIAHQALKMSTAGEIEEFMKTVLDEVERENP